MLARDPVVAERFFAALPDSFSASESELLAALQQVAHCARRLGLPTGVSLQEWAERRVPSERVAEVNQTGLVFVGRAAPSALAPAGRSGAAGRSAARFSEPKASVVGSLVAGVRSLGAGLLGFLRKPKLEEPENGFYYDTALQRWRQHGAPDQDVSQLDFSTGRPKQEAAAALPPPPKGPSKELGTRLARGTAESLYVDPMAAVHGGAGTSAAGNPRDLGVAPSYAGPGMQVAAHFNPCSDAAFAGHDCMEGAGMQAAATFNPGCDTGAIPFAEGCAQATVDFNPSDAATLSSAECSQPGVVSGPSQAAAGGPGDGSLMRGWR
ncbi:unnamed protein product [Effrenium voratum]|uniref:Uncharacterized protein n=1 Tax=Effrenium voratum TaxID=2562239 RepID=A0AA36NF92_9DINO|nr:unnamed protein product [Effrenium voratum]CAJ1423766.1 unnamed protein product [Effrenium voratum]